MERGEAYIVYATGVATLLGIAALYDFFKN